MGGDYYYIILFAHNKREALDIGKKAFEELVTKFDGYQLITWDEDPSDEDLAILNAEDPEGKKLIDQKMDSMWNVFKKLITNVREKIEKCSDEEIFEEDSISRGDFLFIGQEMGPVVELYGYAGPWSYSELSGIINRRKLKKYLNKFSDSYQKKKNPYEELDIFIVPALIRT